MEHFKNNQIGETYGEGWQLKNLRLRWIFQRKTPNSSCIEKVVRADLRLRQECSGVDRHRSEMGHVFGLHPLLECQWPLSPNHIISSMLQYPLVTLPLAARVSFFLFYAPHMLNGVIGPQALVELASRAPAHVPCSRTRRGQ